MARRIRKVRTLQGLLRQFGKDSYDEHRIRQWVRSNFAQPLLKAIENFDAGEITKAEYEEEKERLIFTYRGLMRDLGWVIEDRGTGEIIDGWKHPKYEIAVRFFSTERKKLQIALDVAKETDSYKRLREEGAGVDSLFRALSVYCLRNDVYPLVADAAGPWDEGEIKILERDDFLELIYNRTRRIASEVMEKVERIGAIDQEIPLIEELQKPRLADGSLFEPEALPPATPINCPEDGCGYASDDVAGIIRHDRDEHRPSVGDGLGHDGSGP